MRLLPDRPDYDRRGIADQNVETAGIARDALEQRFHVLVAAMIAGYRDAFAASFGDLAHDLVEPALAAVAIGSVDAVPVEITVTVTVIVPGQTSEDIDEVEIIGSEPEHPIAAPNLKPDEATAALDDGE